jgi:periplasmic protein TonB
MFANFATAISTSTAVTLALFYIMNLLIVIQPHAAVDAEDRMPIIWTKRKIIDTPPETIKDIFNKEFIEPPVPPTTEAPGERGPVVGFARPKIGPTPVTEFTGTGLIIQDGPLVALVRVSPTYPARAQQAGLEGWVLVQFDVLASGNVANIRIVDSSDRVFENSARKAAARFRFKPRVIDGVALVTTGVQNIFRYQMEN